VPQQHRPGGGGEFDVAEEDDLFEFLDKKGVIGVFSLFDQKMAPFLHNPASLGADVYAHARFLLADRMARPRRKGEDCNVAVAREGAWGDKGER